MKTNLNIVGLFTNAGRLHIKKVYLKTERIKCKNMKNMEINESKVIEGAKFSNSRECSICGMGDWCGTDGCPLDPQ